ncbi:hypothetical protein [Bacillus sp. FJAT-27231]|uniref:hypothetical protein n=1 Tax=Bacillus sp. FJAT-27231 TaxID=1679168 RepID=UPI000A57478C|nr:hypothetical protein [Bacillus sp. FJAT-27231]
MDGSFLSGSMEERGGGGEEEKEADKMSERMDITVNKMFGIMNNTFEMWANRFS